MSTPKLMRLLPLLTMVASLAYATYALQPTGSNSSRIPDKSASTKQPAAGKEARPEHATPLDRRAASKSLAVLRDPFQVVSKPSSNDAAKEAAHKAATLTEFDPYPGMIEGLTLSGTFLQGRTQIAIIGGQICEKGQYVRGSNNEPLPLRLAQVLSNEVILQGNNTLFYKLSYPAAPSNTGAKSRGHGGSNQRQARTAAARTPRSGTQPSARARTLSSALRRALDP